jgi:C-terminal processing protease CtpA/Prc
MNSDEISQYIKGIAKSTFCKPKDKQKYISLAHFVSLQPRECMFVKDNFVPDGMISDGKMYIWFPTPGKGKEVQNLYASAARECIDKLVTECDNFSEVIVDVRNNIGGILSTFINAILPLICHDVRFAGKSDAPSYLYGIDKNGKKECDFKICDNTHRIIFSNGESLDDELIPIKDSERDRFAGKKISVLCNKYTMSSGEIVCIIMRMLGHKIYGEKTRGLTNGCKNISSGSIKSALVPYYSISDLKTNYLDGVSPDRSESYII